MSEPTRGIPHLQPSPNTTESFIESAKILAEPYQERIAELTAERDKAREECGAQRRLRESLSDELSRFVRLRREAVADRDRLLALVAAQAGQIAEIRQLASNTWVWGVQLRDALGEAAT